MSIVLAGALAFGFSEQQNGIAKAIWFCAITFMLVARGVDFWVWRKGLENPDFNVKNALSRFRIGCYGTGFLWSFYTLYFFNDMSLIEFSTTVMIISSLAGGAITVLSGDDKLPIRYAAILLVPISIRGLISEELHHNILGTLGIVFTMGMILSAKKSTDFTKRAVLLNNKNVDLLYEQTLLLKEMDEKNAQIVQINENLEKKVESRTSDIYRLSNIDPLTGLANRNAFAKEVDKQLTQQAPNSMALLFIDLDGFKAINDAHGHAIGDKILMLSADRLRGTLAESSLACRWGGDEFIVAISDVTEEQAKHEAGLIIASLSQHIHIDYHHLEIGATIGIALYPYHSKNIEQLILLADTAMYMQKQTAKSSVLVFSAAMHESLQRDILLTQGLSHALDKHQLYIVYQPIVEAQGGKLAFCEALLRWDFDGQNIGPDEFIPIAEHNGIIHQIGTWVLQNACEKANTWQLPDDVKISINMSVMQLMQPNIVVVIEHALATSGLAPSKLHLEVTESVFASDTTLLVNVIKEIRKLNVGVSIDDFGTGFSSLSVLQNLSADVVKIDRSFVNSFSQGGEAIIRATQYMANELNYCVTVEGIETEVQKVNLINTGVKYLQGYYFAKPMRPSELEVWYKQYAKTLTQS